MKQRRYNEKYEGENLNKIAFPLGGIGAGMICIEGTGAVSHVSLRHRPDILNEPQMFSAICIKSVGENGENIARVLEGPVPGWKIMYPTNHTSTGLGGPQTTYGLPRFYKADFEAKFPFANISLSDESIPVEVKISGWSPFTPPNADDSSLPLAGLEFHFANTSKEKIEAVYSFNSRNLMKAGAENNALTRSVKGGFEFYQPPLEKQAWQEGSFCAFVDDPETKVNCAWFRGGWFDPLTKAWEIVSTGRISEQAEITEGDPSPGASLYVPFALAPGEEKTIRLQLAWFVPESDLSVSEDKDKLTYQPWYASKFSSITELTEYWQKNYTRLRQASSAFRDCFYDTDLPAEIIEAIAANLTILKSPTCLRQKDGRFWAWEGCSDSVGSCHGTCTHVWNYAQAMPHLFPSLEQTVRQTELNESLGDDGFQSFRTLLPIQQTKLPTSEGQSVDPEIEDSGKIAAADGQLGSIMRVYREWRISADSEWLKQLWPKIIKSIDYCIKTWDSQEIGVLVEPQHNTYDIEFWGPNGMCCSVYLGALKAVIEIGRTLNDDVSKYESLLAKGRKYMEEELFDGEYFFQKVVWDGLKAGSPENFQKKAFQPDFYASSESKELLLREGPKYQYGKGCLSDGIIGAWMAEVCGLGEILDAKKVESHLLAVYKYNFRKNLSRHANPQRPTYALGDEAGLLLCSWPKGADLSLPFVYSNEVWTGIEYQVAAHLITIGHVDEGLEIVRACRDRYDGKVRNPFDEYECGHWYARAMASYALIQAFTGIRYDAVEKILYIAPRIEGDFKSFLSTATGFATVGVRDGKPFLDIKSGAIEIERIV